MSIASLPQRLAITGWSLHPEASPLCLIVRFTAATCAACAPTCDVHASRDAVACTPGGAGGAGGCLSTCRPRLRRRRYRRQSLISWASSADASVSRHKEDQRRGVVYDLQGNSCKKLSVYKLLPGLFHGGMWRFSHGDLMYVHAIGRVAVKQGTALRQLLHTSCDFALVSRAVQCNE